MQQPGHIPDTPTPQLGLRIGELPSSARGHAEKLAAFVRGEFRALGIPAGDPAAHAEVLKRLASDPTIPDERLEALERATDALVQILRGTGTLSSVPMDYSVGELAKWMERSGLDGMLATPLEEQVARLEKMYSEGGWGYTVPPESIRFSLSAARAEILRAGLAQGALNGVVVVAYPTRAQLAEIAARTNQHLARLLKMPAMAFLEKHFEARGGHIHPVRANWSVVKCAPEGESLSEIYVAKSREMGIEPEAWFKRKADGSLNFEKAELAECFWGVHRAVYEALPDPPTLEDMLDTPPQLVFLNATKEVPETVPLLARDGVRDITMGWDFTFARCMYEGVEMSTPAAELALAGLSPNLDDPETYPTRETRTHSAGIFDDGISDARAVLTSALKDGFVTDVRSLSDSNPDRRARAAFYGDPPNGEAEAD